MKHDQPNDLWFYLKNVTTKEVVDGQLHVVIRVKGGRKLQEGEEIKRTDQALVSQTVTKYTKKVTRKTVINAEGVPVKQDVQVTTTYKGGDPALMGKNEPGYTSVALSPAQANAMFDGGRGKAAAAQKKPPPKKKGFSGNQMYTGTFADAFGEEDEPEGNWQYS